MGLLNPKNIDKFIKLGGFMTAVKALYFAGSTLLASLASALPFDKSFISKRYDFLIVSLLILSLLVTMRYLLAAYRIRTKEFIKWSNNENLKTQVSTIEKLHSGKYDWLWAIILSFIAMFFLYYVIAPISILLVKQFSN